MDPKAANAISELLVNLSAGWVGAIIIIPLNTKRVGKIRLLVLTTNILLATLSLVIAYLLKN